MIANTVIVFLRDLLPVFILFSYLVTVNSHVNMKSVGSINTGYKLTTLNWLQSVITGAIFTLLLFFSAELISDWFDGKGLEIIHVTLIFIAYIIFVSMPFFNQLRLKKHHVVLIFCLGIGTFISLKCTDFIFYFGVHKQQEGQLLNILIGSILGLGICASFSVLFRFFLGELLSSKHNWSFTFLWYLFLAGQFSHITSLLSQVDLIDIGTPVFDVSDIIKDSSEYGYLLNALLGYESSPSQQWLIAYCIGLTIPILLHLIKHQIKRNGVNEGLHHE